MSRTRKIEFGIVTALAVLVTLEGAARAYSALRYGNRHAWTYGWGFLQALHSGALTEEQRTLAGNVVREAQRADEIFAERAHTVLDLVDRPADEPDVVGEYGAHINRLGLRGPDVALEKPPGTTRLLALGGSFVFGWGVVDADTWIARLEQTLQARRAATQVVNGGRNGGTINYALMTLVRLATAMPSDYVLLISTYNNRNLLDTEPHPTWASTAEYYLYNLSLLNVMLEEKISRLRHEALDNQRFRTAVRARPDAIARWRALYRRRLDQIATVCRERHATLMVGGEPQRFYDSRLDRLAPGDAGETARLDALVAQGTPLAVSELEWYLQSLQVHELRDLEARGGAIFLDTASAFMPDKAPWMLDQIHANRSGSERFADLVATAIIPRLPASAR